MAPKPDQAGIGRLRPGQHVDQRGLADAVRPDDAEAVAALDADREVLDDPAIAIAPADVAGLDDELAGLVGFGGGKVGAAGGATIVAALLAQRVEIAEPLDIALAAAGNAVAQPVLLVDDLAVELVLFALFLGQHLVAPGLEGAKAAVDLPDLAAIEPRRAARQVRQEPPVMADQDQRAAAAAEFAFQPFDGGEIEMVGRLVEQQDIGRRRQHARQCGAAGLAAGHLRRIFIAAKAELLQEIARLIAIVAGAKSGLDIGQGGGITGEIRLLRQIADGRARLHEAAAAVGLDQTCGDLQQRRFPGPVAADQGDPLARGHRQFDAGQ